MSVLAFLEACRLPDTTPGVRVKLLRYSNCATKAITHEVRGADGLFPFGYFFGSKAKCLQFMADKGLACVNLDDWHATMPTTQLQFGAA